MPSVLKSGVDLSECSACIDYGCNTGGTPCVPRGFSHQGLDWISDTLSQTYTDVQSLVECLGHRYIVSGTGCIPL